MTIYAWRKRFGQLEAVDVKRLRQIETENERLKKLLAERDLEIELMKEIARNKWSASSSWSARPNLPLKGCWSAGNTCNPSTPSMTFGTGRAIRGRVGFVAMQSDIRIDSYRRGRTHNQRSFIFLL